LQKLQKLALTIRLSDTAQDNNQEIKMYFTKLSQPAISLMSTV